VIENAGKCALICGPLVYCMEGWDNAHHLRGIILDTSSAPVLGYNKDLGVPTITAAAYTRKATPELYSYCKGELIKTNATFIPYYAFANRGIAEMQVWSLYR
jgi:DUF1680 family protein